MIEIENKPNVFNICKKGFESNGFILHKMNPEFKLSRYFKFLLLRYNAKTQNTHVIQVVNLRNLINLCYKKGFTSYNPCGIDKGRYSFQKGAIHNDHYKGNRTSNLAELKYVKK